MTPLPTKSQHFNQSQVVKPAAVPRILFPVTKHLLAKLERRMGAAGLVADGRRDRVGKKTGSEMLFFVAIFVAC